MIEFVNIHGDRVSLDKGGASYTAKPKAKPDQPTWFHKGWRVVGYPAGAVAAAERQATERARAWCALTGEQQARRIKAGERPPKMWDEALWLSKNKPKAARNRPYEVRAAAEQCADLARAAGWTHVRIDDLSKGSAPAPGLF